MPNKLKTETSPYLLQHQNNPVNWYPWSPEALEKAKQENKLILVSIGYSACHWCHVMERESFQDERLAELLNQHFIAIKVDREERPDIDQLYMLAVQLITGHGGWPLNMICLPDSRPVYGGTYFPKADFIEILIQLQEKWSKDPGEMLDYATRLTSGLQQAEQLSVQPSKEQITAEELQEMTEQWALEFDTTNGGFRRAPKFPLPGSWSFLLRYASRHKRSDILRQVHLTLHQMAGGGIYDQIGGGFSRYSVDEAWRVPHFEKMLYDNALLLDLYAQAYLQKREPRYEQVIRETIAWLLRDMRAPSGGFYSALDADSQGEEGKYYTFTLEEFTRALGQETAMQFAPIFQVTLQGNWPEEKTNVLQFSPGSLEEDEGTREALSAARERLLNFRASRLPPGLDDKLICSWNAMLVSGLCSAYTALKVPDYLQYAREILEFIARDLYDEQQGVLRVNPPKGRAVKGFLDDYAFYIKALIDFYEVSLEEWALYRAYELARRVIEDFYEEEAGAFYYSCSQADVLIARKTELMDDVIPSSNSVMIQQLDKLGVIFDEPGFESMVESIIQHMIPQIRKYPSAFSGWLANLDERISGRFEIALCGPDFMEMHQGLMEYYIPQKILTGGSVSSLPFLKGKISDRNQAYLCMHKSCKAPVSDVPELINLIFEPEQKK